MADGSSKPIEAIQPGDMVLAASDQDPEGPVEPKPVVEIYHNRPERLMELQIGDQVIRCTLKHPFYARVKGWTAAADLELGDQLRTHDGRWTALTGKRQEGSVEAVYNLHVEDHHTYFVGDKQKGACVLVHNECVMPWELFPEEETPSYGLEGCVDSTPPGSCLEATPGFLGEDDYVDPLRPGGATTIDTFDRLQPPDWLPAPPPPFMPLALVDLCGTKFVIEDCDGRLVLTYMGKEVKSITPLYDIWHYYDEAIATGGHIPGFDCFRGRGPFGEAERDLLDQLRVLLPECEPHYEVEFTDGSSMIFLGGGPSSFAMAQQALAMWGLRIGVGRLMSAGRVRGVALKGKITGLNATPKAPSSAGSSLIQQNAAQGAAWEQAVLNDLRATQTNVVEQITAKTPSGVRTRLDFLGNDSTGAIIATEAKSSATAPLTVRQAAAFPEIESSGATVVGAGKPPFTGGTKIPPTTVIIRRPR